MGKDSGSGVALSTPTWETLEALTRHCRPGTLRQSAAVLPAALALALLPAVARRRKPSPTSNASTTANPSEALTALALAPSFASGDRSRVRGPSGFTLLEVMLAIVLTSLVVLLAYGAARVSYDAQARLSSHLRELQETRAVREVLKDALRNARAPQRPGDPLFTVHEGQLSFVTAGGGPPFDPDYDWLLTIGPGSGGLELSGIPVGHAPPAPVAVRVPSVTRWDVRVRAAGSAQWLREWPATPVLPQIVAITLWHDSEPVGSPLFVRLLPGPAPVPEGSITE